MLVEINMFLNTSQKICVLISENFNFVECAEHSSCIFACTQNKSNSHLGLYCCEFGKDYDFINEEYLPIIPMELLYSFSTSENTIVVSYKNISGIDCIGAFSNKLELVCENDTTNAELFSFTYIAEEKQLRALAGIGYGYDGAVIFNSNSESAKIIELKEESEIKFSYPTIMVIKGGLELITYNSSSKIFTYMKLPCPIVATEK